MARLDEGFGETEFRCGVAFGGGVMAMAVGAKAMLSSGTVMVAGGRVMIESLMRGDGFRRAGGGVRDRDHDKGGDDQRQRREKSCQTRH
ncbi:hypothetical protein [Brevundimonas sp.]|uniref:hypothetical protein n=1 Tax=Brevundimonas sp. TaxID=1871086 RepID=UPI002EDB44BE